LVTGVVKNSDKFENNLMDALAKVIHEENKNTEVNK
jgi:hypothetical protein